MTFDFCKAALEIAHNSIAKPQKNDLVYLGVKKFVIQHLPSQLQLPAGESNPLQQPMSRERTKRKINQTP
ncbi:hypothetical protein [Calothrix rhizosoleniae]|uniref:hypothetical protein n=1 Tax=Calothrix rhizosoleniae TaxID=888997 RepID=UPI000B4A2C21|nr:hypothetical protein [Calothrix rhizosoleniae]